MTVERIAGPAAALRVGRGSARGMAAIIWTLLGTMVVAMFGCGDGRPEVVAYVSADDYVARPILEAFEEKHDVRVLVRYDTEATKTTGLVNRIRAEADRPAADLLWSSEPFMMAQLAEEGLLEAPPESVLPEWPEAWRDRDRRWHAFSGRARVIVYPPDRIPAAEAPATWMDLLDDRWKGRVVMADPRFGTTRGHLGAMKRYWDRNVMPGYYRAFLEGLAENEVGLLPGGNAAVVEAVASGEADVGLTDTDDVLAAVDRGLAVAMTMPRHDPESTAPGGGTLVIPNTVALVRGGPNPELATRLLEHLLSAEVELALLRSPSRNVPLVHPEAMTPEDAARAAAATAPDPLRVDLGRAAEAMPTAVEEAMSVLVPQGEDAANGRG